MVGYYSIPTLIAGWLKPPPIEGVRELVMCDVKRKMADVKRLILVAFYNSATDPSAALSPSYEKPR